MATEVGVGFVRLVPSMQGFEGQARRLLDDALGDAARRAGEQAGEEAGEGLDDGLAQGARRAGDHAGQEVGAGLDGAQGPAGQAGGAAAGKFGAALKAGVAAAAVAVGLILADALGQALDQSRIAGRLRAQLGATPAEAEKIGKVAGQLYANAVTEDFQGAADAISATMRAGLMPPGATNAQLESIATKVSDVAGTFELDLGQAANAVGQIMKTGLAPNAEEALDVITRGLQEMGPRADDLADTFNEYSVQFQRLGLDATTATGLLSQGLKAGARDTDVVADALKEFTLEGVQGSQKIVDGFKAVGLNATDMVSMISQGGPKATEALQMTLDALRDMEDPVKRDAAAVNLFGTKSEDMQAALLALDPSTAVDALGEVGGAADEMGDALRDNAGTKVEAFKRGITQGLVEFLGGTVLPAVEDFKNVFGGAFDGIDLAGFADQIRPAFDTIKSVIDDAKQTFKDMAADSGMSMGDIRAFVEQTMTQVSQIITSAAELIKVVWDKWGEDIVNVVLIVWRAVSGYVEGYLQWIRGIIKTVTSLIKGDWSGVWDGIKMILGGVWKAISSLLGGALGLLKNQISMALTAVVTYFKNVPGRIISALGSLGAMLYTAGTNAMKRFKDANIAVANQAIAWMKGLPGKLSNAVGSLGSLLNSKGRDLVRGLWNGITSMGSWLRSQLTSWASSQIPGPIAKALGIGSPSKLMADAIGRWIPAGIVDGWQSGMKGITGMAATTATAAMPALPAGAAAGGAAAAAAPTVVINGQGLSRALVEWLRSAVATEAGGNVQRYLGQGA